MSTPEERLDSLWVENIANQYGCRQAAALRGDDFAVKVADFWLAQTASGHWHEIIAACRQIRRNGEDSSSDAKPPEYKFENVICSQCGGEFGPGNNGFSHCENHKHLPRLG